MGRPFNAVIRLSPEFKPEFDFGQGSGGEGADGEGAKADFTGQTPVGQCPKCQSRLFESGNHYVCEQAAATPRTCDFRCGRIILQQPVDRDQLAKLLQNRKTDLLTKFISKRGRPFSAFLVLDADNRVGFEFEKRERKGGERKTSAPKEPGPKLDFTGQEPLGTCPRCGGRVFESETDYLCEKSQAEKRPCKFKSGKVILQLPVPPDQARKLLATGRSDLLSGFISRRGRPFKAWLVLQEGKVAFEFPETDEG
jgi:hypothetical protein